MRHRAAEADDATAPRARSAGNADLQRIDTPAAPSAAAAADGRHEDATDESLMARVQGGDTGAFQQLVRRHTRGLQHFARRMLRDADEADDVTQEALLRVWQHAARWQQGRVQFTTWLFRIAHNQCIDRLRRTQTRREAPSTVRGPDGQLTDTLDAIADTRHDAAPDAQVGDAGRAQRLDVALRALPERQRSALVLCFYQGLSNQQAAEVLDVTVEALESLLARARRALRSALADLRAGADG
jgi:RNA polymerase sigma factor (sigma-70 family)